jgi:hypothetical protein
MLDWIYSDDDVLDWCDIELMEAAHKFKLKKLHTICELYFCES